MCVGVCVGMCVGVCARLVPVHDRLWNFRDLYTSAIGGAVTCAALSDECVCMGSCQYQPHAADITTYGSLIVD